MKSQTALEVYVSQDVGSDTTGNGTKLNPYQTVQKAIDAMPDMATVILAPGTYLENVVIGRSDITSFSFLGGYNATISSLACVANNGAIRGFNLIGLHIAGNLTLTGSANGSEFLTYDCNIDQCLLDGNVALTNLGTIAFRNSKISGSLTVTNCVLAAVVGGDGVVGAVSVVHDAGADQPSGYGESTLLFDNALCNNDVSVSSGSYLQFRNGARVGYSGGSFTNSGMIELYQAMVRSNVMNNIDGTIYSRGTHFTGTVTNNGTLTNIGTFYAGNLHLDSGSFSASNWAGSAPTTVNAAIDRMAALLKTLNSGTAIP